MNPTTLPYGGPRVPALLESLSERERTVLELLCDGYTNDEIAQEMGYLSVSRATTVAKIVAQVTAKLQARNRTHAAVLALRGGLLERTAA